MQILVWNWMHTSTVLPCLKNNKTSCVMALLVLHYTYIPRRFSFRIQYSRKLCS